MGAGIFGLNLIFGPGLAAVHKSASDQDIKKAYKRLSRKYHPDKNTEPGAEDKFVEVAHGAFVHKNLALSGNVRLAKASLTGAVICLLRR